MSTVKVNNLRIIVSQILQKMQEHYTAYALRDFLVVFAAFVRLCGA